MNILVSVRHRLFTPNPCSICFYFLLILHARLSQASLYESHFKTDPDSFAETPYSRWISRHDLAEKREANPMMPMPHTKVTTTLPALSAVLMECPRESFVRRTVESVVGSPSGAGSKCDRRILVNIRMASSGQMTDSQPHYVLIDEIYDPSRKSMASLMSPYLLEITRNEPVLMYPMKFNPESVRGQNKAASNRTPEPSVPPRPPIPSPVNYTGTAHTPFSVASSRSKGQQLLRNENDDAAAVATQHDTPSDSLPSAGKKHATKHLIRGTKGYALGADSSHLRQEDYYDDDADTAAADVWPGVMQQLNGLNYPDPLEPAVSMDDVVRHNANEFAFRPKDRRVSNMYPINAHSSLTQHEQMQRQHHQRTASTDSNRPPPWGTSSYARFPSEVHPQLAPLSVLVSPSSSSSYANAAAHPASPASDDGSENFYYPKYTPKSSEWEGNNDVKSGHFPGRLSDERQRHDDDDENLIRSRKLTFAAPLSGEPEELDAEILGTFRGGRHRSGEQWNSANPAGRCNCANNGVDAPDEDHHNQVQTHATTHVHPPKPATCDGKDPSHHFAHRKIIKTQTSDIAQSSFRRWPHSNDEDVPIRHTSSPVVARKDVVKEERHYYDEVELRAADVHHQRSDAEQLDQQPSTGGGALSDEEYLSVEFSQQPVGYKVKTFNQMTFNPSRSDKFEGMDTKRPSDDSERGDEFENDFSPNLSDGNGNEKWQREFDEASSAQSQHFSGVNARPPPRSGGGPLKRQRRRTHTQPYDSRNKRSYDGRSHSSHGDWSFGGGDFGTDLKRLYRKEEPSYTSRSMLDRGSSKAAETPSVEDIWHPSAYNMNAPSPFLTTELRFFRRQHNTWWTVAPMRMLSNTSSVYANRNRSIMSLYHTDILRTDQPPKLHETKADRRSTTNQQWLMENSKTNERREFRMVCETETDDINPQISDQSLKRDCENKKDYHVPEHNITIELPFDHNALIYPKMGRVRISQIILDYSKYHSANVLVTIMNTGLTATEFHLRISECPIADVVNFHKIQLVEPFQSHTFSFAMHMFVMLPKQSHACIVSLTDGVGRIAARRSMLVRTRSRCFCIWKCACVCLGLLVRADATHLCELMPVDELDAAGFDSECTTVPETGAEVFNWIGLWVLVLAFFCIILLLGCLKGILGTCFTCIGKWKYDYMQPHQTFSESSKCKRFFINSIFFLVLPCVVICKCFNPDADDYSLAKWKRKVVQKRTDVEMQSDNESDLLLRGFNQASPVERLRAAGNLKDSNSSDRLFDSYNDDDEQRDTSYVLSALTESRLSLKLLDGHNSGAGNSPVTSQRGTSARNADAMTFVNRLLTAKLVYRTVSGPLGHANVEANQSFSVRGYFMPAMGPGYQFISHIPLRQHWRINKQSNTLEAIDPPLMLLPKEFTRDYANKEDVWRAHDLSVTPSVDAPCITVLIQDIALYLQHEESGR